jgi:hypothetical protein
VGDFGSAVGHKAPQENGTRFLDGHHDHPVQTVLAQGVATNEGHLFAFNDTIEADFAVESRSGLDGLERKFLTLIHLIVSHKKIIVDALKASPLNFGIVV